MDKIANYLQPAQTTPSIQPFPVTQSRYQPPATLEYPPLLTTPNRVGRDRDREIRLRDRDRDREKVDAEFFNKMRPRRDCLIFYVKDDPDTRLNLCTVWTCVHSKCPLRDALKILLDELKMGQCCCGTLFFGTLCAGRFDPGPFDPGPFDM